MLTAVHLGDAKADLTALLNQIPVVGPSLVSALPTVGPYVHDQAEEGAKDAVKPYILGLGAVSVLALLGSVVALVKLKRRS